jgi:hypothetical protein
MVSEGEFLKVEKFDRSFGVNELYRQQGQQIQEVTPSFL